MKSQSTAMLSKKVIKLGTTYHLTVSGAESCTGGLISKLLTDISGSSAVFVGSCVTYTNNVKMHMLGVDPAIIDTHTEVSYACAEAMATGARQAFLSDIAYSTTGYAGPGGGTEADPVGTVYIGISTAEKTVSYRLSLPKTSSRTEIRREAARFVLQKITELFGDSL